MEPYVGNTVTFRLMLAGYRSAVGRYDAGRMTLDAAATFLPLFEALNWAVALDDQVRERWSPHGAPLDWAWRDKVAGGVTVAAVRFVRNRVHHQWADALQVESGVSFPVTMPMVLHEWCWRRSVDLPAGGGNSEREIYDEVLAGRAARHALRQLDETYSNLADLLERPVTS